MNFRSFVFAAACTASLLPSLSHASERASLKACARALAESLATTSATVPSYKVAYNGSRFSTSALEYYGVEYTFDLKARDPKSGATLATAECTTNWRGRVTALNTTPADLKTQVAAR